MFCGRRGRKGRFYLPLLTHASKVMSNRIILSGIGSPVNNNFVTIAELVCPEKV